MLRIINRIIKQYEQYNIVQYNIILFVLFSFSILHENVHNYSFESQQ